MRLKSFGLIVSGVLILHQTHVTAQAASGTISIGQAANPSENMGAGLGTYVVRDGDTLWDICDVTLSDPWGWPNVWALNPHITNPNWIYPGDILRLKVGAVQPQNENANKVYQSPTEFRQKFSKEDLAHTVVAQNVGLISERAYKESGFIKASREEKTYLAVFDEVYLQFENMSVVSAGQMFSVYRDVDPVVDSGHNYGYRVNFLGQARVLSVHEKYAKAVITETAEEIVRGDKIVPAVWRERQVKPVKNTRDLNATIIDIHRPPYHIGQHHYLFIDRGQEDGVQVGNRLHVLLKGDGLDSLEESESDDLPDEVIGEIIVVDVRPKSSLTIVTRSHREFDVGFRLVMKAGY